MFQPLRLHVLARSTQPSRFRSFSRNAGLFARLTVALLAAFLSALTATGQENGITLTIGSSAPSLDIEHWVSDRDGAFESVTDFEDGKIYIVEFWATWCGPCVSSMPHLAKLQDKYADQNVQIISVSDEDLETVNGFLANVVRGEDELTYGELTSKYCLTTDPDGSTSRDYMEAAGQNGIPTCFIVGKTGLIEWTGHPMSMDKPLKQMIAGEWDREAFQAMQKKQQEEEAARRLAMVKLQKIMVKVEQQLDAGQDEAVIETLNELVDDDEFSVMREQLIMIRSQIALTIGGPAAIKAFEAGVEELKEFPQALNELAWNVVEATEGGESVGDDMMAAALSAAQKALESDPSDTSVLDTIAHIHHLRGDLDKAIEAQEKAVANAGALAPQVQPYLDQLKAEQAAVEQ